VALELIIGPAHAGKVAELHARYLADLRAGRPAVLVVPDQAAKARTQADLLARAPALVGADIATFDDLFERILRDLGDARPVLRGTARRLLLRRALPTASEALATRLGRLGSALIGPDEARALGDGRLADAYAAWWAALDAQPALDRGRMRLEAVRALRGDVAAWPAGRRLFAEGFEDLSPAQEALLDVIAQRAGAVASLPYEAGRPAFAVLQPAVERLAERAGQGGITELGPGDVGCAEALVRLERRLGEPDPDARGPAPAGDAIGVWAVEGERGEAEAVLLEVAAALRAGTSGDRIAVVAPRGADGRERLVRELRDAGIAVAAPRRAPLQRTPFGRALLALLALAWAPQPTDEERLVWLRSPWSGAPAHLVERCERQLRRSTATLTAALAEAGEPIRCALALPPGVRGDGAAAAEAAAAVRAMLARAHGVAAPAADAAVRADAAIAADVLRALAEIGELSPPPGREEVRDLLGQVLVREPDAPERAVAVLDPRTARTADVDVLVAVGLEEPMYGAPPAGDPLAEGPDRAELARHLVYTAATRPRERLVLVWRLADDEGRTAPPPAIWEDLMEAAGEPPVRRRRFCDATLPLEGAPTTRERARAIAAIAPQDRERALRLAGEAGISHAISRAIAVHRRRLTLTDARILDELAATERFNATAIELFGDCSSKWFVERQLGLREIDRPIDDRLAKGQLAHKALARFYREVPARLGTTAVTAERIDEALVELRRIVEEVVGDVTPKRAGDELALRLMAWSMQRDLARLVRRAARTEAPLVPSEFEVPFGGARGGLDVGPARVTGQIDRIDIDPAFTARAIVVDYKTSTISTGPKILEEERLQLPLYLLALREVLGREPVGGLYVSIRKGAVRGIVDASQEDVLPAGLSRADRLEHDAFEAALERARAQAAERIELLRAGAIGHDPRGGRQGPICARFCGYAGICRVRP
jgi:RecB family exonuclease